MNLSKGRLKDSAFDVHLLRAVLLLRAKEVKVTNAHIILLAKKLLDLPRYRYSKAQELQFSTGWLMKWKQKRATSCCLPKICQNARHQGENRGHRSLAIRNTGYGRIFHSI